MLPMGEKIMYKLPPVYSISDSPYKTNRGSGLIMTLPPRRIQVGHSNANDGSTAVRLSMKEEMTIPVGLCLKLWWRALIRTCPPGAFKRP